MYAYVLNCKITKGILIHLFFSNLLTLIFSDLLFYRSVHYYYYDFYVLSLLLYELYSLSFLCIVKYILFDSSLLSLMIIFYLKHIIESNKLFVRKYEVIFKLFPISYKNM